MENVAIDIFMFKGDEPYSVTDGGKWWFTEGLYDFARFIVFNTVCIQFFLGIVQSSFSYLHDRYQTALTASQRIENMLKEGEGSLSRLFRFRLQSMEDVKSTPFQILIERKRRKDLEGVRKVLRAFKDFITILKRQDNIHSSSRRITRIGDSLQQLKNQPERASSMKKQGSIKEIQPSTTKTAVIEETTGLKKPLHTHIVPISNHKLDHILTQKWKRDKMLSKKIENSKTLKEIFLINIREIVAFSLTVDQPSPNQCSSFSRYLRWSGRAA
jgi:hypothetical protein